MSASRRTVRGPKTGAPEKSAPLLAPVPLFTDLSTWLCTGLSTGCPHWRRAARPAAPIGRCILRRGKMATKNRHTVRSAPGCKSMPRYCKFVQYPGFEAEC
jgi:hypothetical protein